MYRILVLGKNASSTQLKKGARASDACLKLWELSSSRGGHYRKNILLVWQKGLVGWLVRLSDRLRSPSHIGVAYKTVVSLGSAPGLAVSAWDPLLTIIRGEVFSQLFALLLLPSTKYKEVVGYSSSRRCRSLFSFHKLCHPRGRSLSRSE